VAEEHTPAVQPRRARFIAIQWVSGPLFFIGLLGMLRHHFDRLFDAPGVSIASLRASPFGYLLLFIVGVVGIAALRAERLGARYLPISAVVLAALAAIGGLAGGANADGLALNDRMIIVLLVLAAGAAVVALVDRRKRTPLS